jgi:hypothetical protein
MSAQLPGSCGKFQEKSRKGRKISSKEQFEIRAKIDFEKKLEKIKRKMR